MGTSAWRYPLAVLPVVPCAFVLLSIVCKIRRMDELQRRIQFEALVVSSAATTMITVTYGFLENAGLPRLSWIWVGPMMVGIWGARSPASSPTGATHEEPVEGVARRAELVAGRLRQRARVSRQTTNAIETGRYDPSLPLAFAIAKLFDLRIEDIFFPDELLPDGEQPADD